MREIDRQTAEAMAALLKNHDDHQAAIDEIHRHLSQNGLLSLVTVHKYMCKRGCQISTVFIAGGLTLCAVRDYKYSPGLNNEVSVPEARERNTIDGKRHWPSHVHDVGRLATWGPAAGIGMNCRHFRGNVLAVDIQATVQGVLPGKPNAPTRL